MYYFSYSTSSFAFSRLAALCHILFARSYSLQGILGLNMIMGSHPRISWSNMSFRDISSLRMYNMRIHKGPFEDLMAPWLSLSEGARLASFLRLATDLGGADLREELIWERADLRRTYRNWLQCPQWPAHCYTTPLRAKEGQTTMAFPPLWTALWIGRGAIQHRPHVWEKYSLFN